MAINGNQYLSMVTDTEERPNNKEKQWNFLSCQVTSIERVKKLRDFKESTYWSVWSDCCRLHKTYFGIEEADTAAWERLFADAKGIQEKYKDSNCRSFVESQILLIVAELEQKSKGDQTKGKK